MEEAIGHISEVTIVNPMFTRDENAATHSGSMELREFEADNLAEMRCATHQFQRG